MDQISDAELARMNRPRVWLFDSESCTEPPCWELGEDGLPQFNSWMYAELLAEGFKAPGVGLWVADGEYRRPDPDEIDWEEAEDAGDLPYAFYVPGATRPATPSDLVRLKLLPEDTALGYAPAAQVDAGALEAERDELWAAMQRVALNLCDCDARDGEECPVEPALHRDHCRYACAHAPVAQEDDTPLEWDDNFSLAREEG